VDTDDVEPETRIWVRVTARESSVQERLAAAIDVDVQGGWRLG
jgi:hypothetical protein